MVKKGMSEAELSAYWDKEHKEYREKFKEEYDEIFWQKYKKYDGGEFCPVCQKHLFTIWNGAETCPICGWQDDAVQEKHPDERGGCNRESLNEKIAWWKKNGGA